MKAGTDDRAVSEFDVRPHGSLRNLTPREFDTMHGFTQ